MSRTFQDADFLVWEVFPSGGKHGFSEHPHLVFHCLTNRSLRPRWIHGGEDEAEAQRVIEHASNEELLALLGRSEELD